MKFCTFRNLVMFAGVTMMLASSSAAMSRRQLEEAMNNHPAGDQLQRLFPHPAPPLPDDFQPTRLTRKDYLRLAAGNVDFWKKYQSPDGAILDYNEADAKNPKGLEKQYSTPAFALAAATLVNEAGRQDLLEPAVRAFDFSLAALLNQTTANHHADFYIPMLVHAHRVLRTRVPAQTAAKWDGQFKAIIPKRHYRDSAGGANWNIVNVAGEALRRKDGLVAPEQAEAQQKYLDAMLQTQQRRFTPLGMYQDPHEPLAYDAFPRLWLDDMLADPPSGAYDGPARAAVERFLATGAFSSLLLTSPSGEWACGGRSGHHQWNEAQNAVIGEINAVKWKAAGRDDIAGAFKRMARMGLKSMLRWQRPSGEMWIVKNFAEPQTRLGFEGYSFHSQYNLLPMAMLCIAYQHADDSIDERPLPAEYGTYLFDAREPFRQVIAASGGYYVQINTAADSHYNATGLQRVHRRGVELSPLSDSAAGQRSYHAAKDDPKVALAPGIQWKLKGADEWMGLGDFHRSEPPLKAKPNQTPQEIEPQKLVVTEELEVAKTSADRVNFMITNELDGPASWLVASFYSVSEEGVTFEQRLAYREPATPDAKRFAFPALANDGGRDCEVNVEGGSMTVRRAGGVLKMELLEPEGMRLILDRPRIATHNGYIRPVVADLPLSSRMIGCRIQLEPAPWVTAK